MTNLPRVAAFAAALALAGSAVVPVASASVPAEDPVATPSPTPTDPLGAQIADATSQLQTDLTEMQDAQSEAEARYLEARKKANQLHRLVARQQAEVDEARRVIGQYARTIYMSGSTDLSVYASMIDPADPADLMNSADTALRVSDHKDKEYDRAVQVLKRNQEVEAQANQAEAAAQASLDSISNQMNDLRRQLADVAGEWADHLAGQSNLIDSQQARANSDAAAQWAQYLTELADMKVPSVSELDLKSGRVPKGIKVSRKNPMVATYSNGERTVTVLPERVVAAVTYGVSTLGTPYHWRKNTGSEMDCSALVDRAWNVPSVPRDKRTDARPLVPDGVPGLAERTRLVPTGKMSPGDVTFLTDPRRGVHHTGIVLDSDTMIAADARTGGVNAVPIPTDRIWQVGRLSIKGPRGGNYVPKATKKPFQCGADPAGFIQMPDGKILADPSLCPPKPAVFAEGNLQAATITVGRCAAALWPAIQIIGGWRPSDPYPDHPSGRAADIMMPAGCSPDAPNVALGTAIAEFFMKNAAKFNVQYIIWQQRIWTAGSAPTPVVNWRGMSDRGSCTANHQDHVHVTVNGPNIFPGGTSDTGGTDDTGDTDTGDTDEGGSQTDNTSKKKPKKD